MVINAKMKIIFYVGSLTKGGAQRVIINLTESLLEKGYGITIVTTVKERDEYELPKGAKRKISDLTEKEINKSRLINLGSRLKKLRRIWKEEKPDLIVSFIGKNNFMAILTSFGLKIPVVVSVRGEPTEEYYTGLLRFLARYLFRAVSGIILQTEDSKKFFPKKTLEKAVVLPNPLNPLFLEEQYQREPKKKIVLVGRIDKNKNQRMAIRAFSKISSDFPDYWMEIWGDGEDREVLTELIKDLGMEEKIFLCGVTNEVKEKMKTASLYLLTSNTEGMPNSLMEAMALGLPVISTDCPCGGPKELIQNGKNGLLVPVGDEEAMAKAMKQVLKNKELREELGKNALKIREQLHPETVNAKWEEYLSSRMKNSAKQKRNNMK